VFNDGKNRRTLNFWLIKFDKKDYDKYGKLYMWKKMDELKLCECVTYNMNRFCCLKCFVLNTLLDSDQTVGVRTGLEIPCEALLRLKIQQQTIHVE
jgi:hypothetical protein